MQQWANAERVEIRIVGQAFGLIMVALRSADDTGIELIDQLRAQVRPSGGSVVALQIPETLRGRFDVWGCNSNALPLMREIKRRFDPNRILNPGRFVGNI
jgi:glycolate oxidase FAD binding subunit